MRNHVIKKADLPADQVEPVSIDERVFLKRGPRIPRDQITLEEAEVFASPDRYAYRQRGVLQREEAAPTAAPYVVPAPAFEEEDFSTADAIPTSDPEPHEEEDAEEDPIEALREELEAEWQKKLEQAADETRAEGHEAGYAEGYDAGYAAAQEELTQQFETDVKRLAADVARLEQIWRDAIEDSHPALLEIAVDVAEALLDAPLPESIRGASARAIAEAVEELAGADVLTVSLHPVDYQRLQEKGLIDQLNANHEQSLRWNPDPERPEGDWSVESPEAVIRHYKSEILDTVDQLLGTTPPDVHGASHA